MSEFAKYDIYTTCQSIYCYKDSDVLKNRFGIRNAVVLRQVETDLVALRQTELLMNSINGRFSASHLCAIHRYLFGEVYPFAGHYRREDISKGQTRFLHYTDITSHLSTLLGELRTEKYLTGLPFDEFVSRLAYYFAELNYIHPFREGNGRATREFVRLLVEKFGCEIDWSRAQTNAFLEAIEASVFDYSVLCPILRRCIYFNN